MWYDFLEFVILCIIFMLVHDLQSNKLFKFLMIIWWNHLLKWYNYFEVSLFSKITIHSLSPLNFIFTPFFLFFPLQRRFADTTTNLATIVILKLCPCDSFRLYDFVIFWWLRIMWCILTLDVWLIFDILIEQVGWMLKHFGSTCFINFR